MVNFKIYDKRQKKFVGQHFAGKAWTVRFSLGIWDNRVSDTRLGEMYKIMNNNDKHLILYVKIDGRYKPVTKEIIATIENLHKKGEPERKERRKKFREEAPWRAQIIDYITMHHNDDYLYRQYLMQIILTQSYLKQHNIPYIMMDAFGNHKAPQRSFPENSHIVSKVDTNHFIGWPNETMADWTVGLPQGPGGHFLDAGHTVVAEKLCKKLIEFGFKNV